MPVEMNAREKENRKKAIEHLNEIEKHKEALRNLTDTKFPHYKNPLPFKEFEEDIDKYQKGEKGLFEIFMLTYNRGYIDAIMAEAGW